MSKKGIQFRANGSHLRSLSTKVGVPLFNHGIPPIPAIPRIPAKCDLAGSSQPPFLAPGARMTVVKHTPSNNYFFLFYSRRHSEASFRRQPVTKRLSQNPGEQNQPLPKIGVVLPRGRRVKGKLRGEPLNSKSLKAVLERPQTSSAYEVAVPAYQVASSTTEQPRTR